MKWSHSEERRRNQGEYVHRSGGMAAAWRCVHPQMCLAVTEQRENWEKEPGSQEREESVHVLQS